ncbi:ATP-binding protein [Azonexus sp.]|jgi:signal transduction histidine kinase/CheY-like chemotaxis protein|uniref:ATP-binding protein n=1 Tax=Azonexus sp. TaxID=1872668 RepID=UPI00281916EB|nr:ATP-binding protein [Azonexus sp.]MDR1995764.1 response regulator [Azonexus sp.]
MTLRIKAIIIIMGIVFVFAGSSFLLSLSFAQRSMTKIMEQELLLALDIAEKLIATKINKLKSDATLVAERAARIDSKKEMQKILAEQVAEFDDFLSLAVVDKNGIFAKTGQGICESPSIDTSAFIQKALDGESNISTTYYDTERNNIAMCLFVPMADGRVLSVSIPGLIFSDLVSDFKLWQTGNVFMVDDEGVIIANIQRHLVLERYNLVKSTETDPDLHDSNVLLRKMISSDKVGQGEYVFGGQRRFSVFKPVGNNSRGWHIAIAAPLNESPAAAAKITVFSLSLFLLLMAVGFVVAIIISGFVVKPFRKIKGQEAEIRKEKDEIEKLAMLLRMSNHSASLLLTITDGAKFANSLMDVLKHIGIFMKVDRIHIWQNAMIDGALYYKHTYEWLSEYGIQKNLATRNSYYPYSVFSSDFNESLSRNICLITSISTLSPQDRGILSRHDIKSVLVIPIHVQEKYWGLITFDDCQHERDFSPDEIDILRSISLMMVNTILRHDMTESLQAANEAKSDFLAKMSHEMRTPLTAVIGLSQLALEEDGLPEAAQLNLEKINGAGQMLLSLVNDILDISKIEAGKFEIIENQYDTPSLISDIVSSNILRIGEKQIEFVLDIDQSLPAYLVGDELRVKQVISNLLSNAFKYTMEGIVELNISCLRDGDVVWLTARIKDTGQGIKPEFVDKLFINYEQVDTKSNRKIEGTGLGLPIAKSMAEMMGGAISVESEYGKGSTFTVRLKQKYVNDSVIGTEVVKNLKNLRYVDPKLRRNAKFDRVKLPYAKVLVVDDNLTNLEVAKGLMKPYRMQVDCVTSGRQAIDAIRDDTVRYNAVFMDHMMPEMDGIEATQIIREQIGTEYAKSVPIIALTANAISGNEEMFLRNGFQAFLSKPIDISRLDAIIHQWLWNKEQENQFIEQHGNLNGPCRLGGENEQAEQSSAGGSRELERRMQGVEVDGLDIENGIGRFAGDVDAYLKVLRIFAVNTALLFEKIESVTADSLSDYSIVVHGIKGSSRTICANAVGDMAEALENAANSEDFDFIAAGNAPFLTAGRRLIAAIGELLARLDINSPKPKKDRPDMDVLGRILEACKVHDMETVEEAITELESYEYESGGEIVPWLWESARQYNVEQIIEKLSTFCDGSA